MSDVNLTVVGHVGTNPTLSMSEHGTEWATFRMASTRRVRDPLTGQWSDGATLWFTVKSWRDKARNIAHSLRKGDPVVVTGRLTVDEWTTDREISLPDGTTTMFPEPRYKLVIEAQHVGVDATRGLVRYAPVVDRGSAAGSSGGRGAGGAAAGHVLDPWSTPASSGAAGEHGAAGGPADQEEPEDASGELGADLPADLADELPDELADELSGLLEGDRVGA